MGEAAGHCVSSSPAQLHAPSLGRSSAALNPALVLVSLSFRFQVVSNRMVKSVLVAVTRLTTVPKYNLRVRRTKKFMVREKEERGERRRERKSGGRDGERENLTPSPSLSLFFLFPRPTTSRTRVRSATPSVSTPAAPCRNAKPGAWGGSSPGSAAWRAGAWPAAG